MHPASRHGTLGRAAFASAVLLSFVVLFAPARDVPSAPPGVDKVVHALLFAVLGITGRWSGVRGPVLAVLLTGYGATSELLQAVTPLGRSASMGDWLADVLGVGAGLLAWTRLSDGGRRAD